MGIGVGISLQSCIQAVLRFREPPSWISGSSTDDTIDKFDPENVGVAAGILCLASLEAEIYVMSRLFPVTGRHL